jgi:hypothetical protein
MMPKKTYSRPMIVEDETSAKAASQKPVKAPRNNSNDSKAQDQIMKNFFVVEKPDNNAIVIPDTEERVNQSLTLS